MAVSLVEHNEVVDFILVATVLKNTRFLNTRTTLYSKMPSLLEKEVKALSEQ